MKIKKIKVINFKSIKCKEFDFVNTTTVLTGKNGKGKTAFIQALYAGLTGDFPAGCITNGETYSTIEITLDDGTVFSRTLEASKTKPNRVKVNGRATPAKRLVEVLESRTDVSKDALKIITSSDVLENMSSQDFGDFILSYLDEKLDIDTILDYISDLTPEMEDELRNFFPDMPIKFGINKVKEADEAFTEQRKITKREIVNRKARTDGFTMDPPKRKLKDIEEDLAEIIGKEASHKSALAAIDLYNSAIANRNTAIKAVEDLKKKIDSIVVSRPNPIVLENIQKQKKDILEKKTNAQFLVKVIKRDIEVFEETLTNLASPVCPLSDTLVCTTDKTKAKEEFEDILQSNKDGLKIHSDIITSLDEQILKLNKEEENYRSDENSYNMKSTLNSQYEERKKNIPSLPPKPDEVETINFEAEKKILNKERDNFLEYDKYLKEMNQLAVLEERFSVLNKICNSLKLKGEVMEKIITYYVSVFEAACNDRAKDLRPGFELKFIFEQGVKYLAKTESGGEFKCYDSLSSGEKTFTMFLILDMLNVLSNLKILILDDLDKLDSTAFEELTKVIQSKPVQDFYEHIIVCAVDHPDTLDTLSKYTDINMI